MCSKWEGEKAFVLEPTVTDEEAAALVGSRVIAVKDAYRSAPWADVIYSNEREWFESKMAVLRQSTDAGFWCGDKSFRHLYVNTAQVDDETIKAGDTACAVMLAIQFGASEVVVVQ